MATLRTMTSRGPSRTLASAASERTLRMRSTLSRTDGELLAIQPTTAQAERFRSPPYRDRVPAAGPTLRPAPAVPW